MTSEPVTVLIVDDRAANRYTTAHALTRAGYQVIEASTGREGLELAKQLPTVIVLDVRLPDILGYEVCRRIKANSQTKHIPVLQLSSAFLTNESKLYALESGADAHLIQPADPVVLVATVRSLVRLHRAEAGAQFAANQWQATFDALIEGVAIVDSRGRILRCNRAMTSLFGMPYGAIEQSDLSDLVRKIFGPDVMQAAEPSPVEVRSGDRFFRLRLDRVVSQDTVVGSIFIVAESTQQKRAEEALLVSERLAATGRMAHTIAHEINNPLEALTNIIYLLQTSLDEPETFRELVNSAASELERVSRISRQILSFNRESSSPVGVPICELMEDVLALNNRAIVEREIEVTRIWDTALLVHCFPAQLRQVFSNLVRNALEASFTGGMVRIKISSSFLRGSDHEPAVRVSIADYGVGIPAENRNRIFDAFFTTKDLKGSGVGLWLSTTIINEHGGRLQMRSSTRASRSGTCMSVLIPCRSVR